MSTHINWIRIENVPTAQGFVLVPEGSEQHEYFLSLVETPAKTAPESPAVEEVEETTEAPKTPTTRKRR